ncbi:hypothetical protein AXW97_10915 [Pseudomonas aeruginosa]|nr:hypothetical protein AXW97_10915 [Pseudomonas aeruginosa]
METDTAIERSKKVDNEMKQLRAQVEAQGIVIAELLESCLEVGQLDPERLIGCWQSFRSSPTFFAVDPREKRLLADELDAWAEVVIGLTPPQSGPD